MIEPARHREVEPRVVDDVVELAHEGQLAVARGVELGRMADEKQRDREPDRDPDEMLFQGLRP